MKSATLLTALVAATANVVSAKPVQPEYQHSIPEVLSEGKPVPHWNLKGSTKVFSDRLTLTDLGLPNQQGGAWSAVPNDYEKWTLAVDFSVAGPINPGGGLALWYTTEEGALGPVHGANDNWDGLGLFIDSEMHKGDQDNDKGTIRGYLNDGTMQYLSGGGRVDEKAFALCHLAYRNVGYNTKVEVSYQPGFFRIRVNGQLCFQTDHIVLPKGGFFGLSAGNTDNADSFILHRVQVYSDIVPKIDEVVPGEKKEQKVVKQEQQQQPPQQRNDAESQALDAVLRKLDLLSSQQQHQGGSAQDASAAASQQYQQEISHMKDDLRRLHDTQSSHQTSIEKKLNSLESVIKDLVSLQRSQIQQGSADSTSLRSQRDKLEADVKKLHSRLDELNTAVKDHTTSLVGSIPDTISEAITKGGPSIWMVFTLLIVIQGGVFVGYLVYKTRRGSYHAKML